MSNPEIVNSMAQNNPLFAGMLGNNPRIGELLSNPSYIKLAMRMISDPVLGSIVTTGEYVRHGKTRSY
eukprot:gnl/Chilomastix_caulleri/5429.p1 GENE.gnl/Chilomastix_caulleri/5429~~gnl/Chilomastix_caulleri/5429.p1  ORF type:complete len:68 (-),score=10.40 gnl/Chilomastix_caulleri/5429:112-315(-)